MARWTHDPARRDETRVRVARALRETQDADTRQEARAWLAERGGEQHPSRQVQTEVAGRAALAAAARRSMRRPLSELVPVLAWRGHEPPSLLRRPDTMIPLEQYADLCARMAHTAGDETQELAIAAAQGVSAEQWRASKAAWTARMQDPNDMGRTAMAFMPLYNAALARARGGAEPCTLELYAKVHAEMALRKDATGNQIDYNIVLAEHGFSHQAWIECESYWTPLVGAELIMGQPNPRYDPVRGQQFRALVHQHMSRLTGQ